MRVLRNPVAQFLAAGLIVVVAVALASDRLSREAAEAEAIADARATTARAVAEPAIPSGLARGGSYAAVQFGQETRNQLMIDNVVRVKIWNGRGQVVWSDEDELIGRFLDLSAEARAVLRSGTTAGEVADLRRQENVYEVKDDGLLEVYTRIEAPEGPPLLFEVYYSDDQLADTTAVLLDAFRPITVGGTLFLGLLTVPLLWGLNRRLGRCHQVVERGAEPVRGQVGRVDLQDQRPQ